jgi:hypothetical protein
LRPTLLALRSREDHQLRAELRVLRLRPEQETEPKLRLKLGSAQLQPQRQLLPATRLPPSLPSPHPRRLEARVCCQCCLRSWAPHKRRTHTGKPLAVVACNPAPCEPQRTTNKCLWPSAARLRPGLSRKGLVRCRSASSHPGKPSPGAPRPPRTATALRRRHKLQQQGPQLGVQGRASSLCWRSCSGKLRRQRGRGAAAATPAPAPAPRTIQTVPQDHVSRSQPLLSENLPRISLGTLRVSFAMSQGRAGIYTRVSLDRVGAHCPETGQP